MTRRILIIVAALAGVGLLVAGVAAAYVFRPHATPSGALTAIPVQATNTTAVLETATAAGATQAPLPSGIVVAEVVQSESQVRFIIDEVLNGQPKSVVGVTDQVAAQILIDPANPANVQMGVIQVNARTLVTDNDFRNRALQNEILQTGLYEFITFTPKSFIGLPATGAVGDTFVFQIVGDLTVRDVTREVTFDVTVTVDSNTQMHGLARAVISRENFGLGLIDLPRQVASVKDAVTLELEFVARAVE
jgi:polyisoprenoid-binding protein YceI